MISRSRNDKYTASSNIKIKPCQNNYSFITLVVTLINPIAFISFPDKNILKTKRIGVLRKY